MCKEPKRERKRHRKKEQMVVRKVMKRAIRTTFETWWYAMRGFQFTGNVNADNDIKKKILMKHRNAKHLI